MTKPVKQGEPTPANNSDWKEEFEDFWLPLITTKGKLDIKKIKNELHDYDFILEQLPKVYCHVTGGRLSKAMYRSETVISVHDDCCHEYCIDKDDHEEEIRRFGDEAKRSGLD